MKIRRTGIAIPFVLCAAMLAACGGNGDSQASTNENDSTLVAAAKEEGSLTWYTADNPATNKRAADAFEDKYGINVKVVRAISGDLEPRFLTEVSSGNIVADVMMAGDPPFFEDSYKKGLFKNPNDLDLPNLNKWPEEYSHDFGTVVSINAFGIGYNTDLVRKQDVPKNWKDVLKFKDSMLLIDIRNAAAYLTVANLLYNELGPEFLKAIGDAKPKLTPSTVPGAQSLAAGEAKVLIPTMNSYIQEPARSGAPINFVFASPATGNEEVLAVVADSPHPNAAKLFLDFMTSEDGQATVVASDLISPAGMAKSAPLPDDYTSPDFTEALANKSKLSELLGLR